MFNKIPIRFSTFALTLTCSSLCFISYAQTISVDTTPEGVEGYALAKFGGNLTYLEGGNGTVDGSGLPTGVADKIEEIQLDWVRFPGGTVSDVYQWENAIGPVGDRENQLHAFQNKLTPTPLFFGPHEASDLVNRWGGELFGLVNINRSANDAARFVEYVNAEYGTNPRGGEALADQRNQNGSQAAFVFNVFEVGNESGGRTKLNWFSYDYNENPLGAATTCPTSAPGLDDLSRWTEMLSPIDLCVPGTPVDSAYILNTASQSFVSERSFVRQLAVKQTTWHHSSAEILTTADANQMFFLKYPPAKNVILTIAGETWAEVSVLSGNGKEFLLDKQAGQITFGDGNNGDIPTSGELIYADYTSYDHDDFKTFETIMKNADPDIKVVATHFNVAKEARDNISFNLDGYQIHGGGWLNDKDPLGVDIYPQPAGISPHNVCVGRAFGTFPEYLDSETSIISSRPDVGVYFSEYSFSRNLDYLSSGDDVEHALTMCSAILHTGILMGASRDEQVKYIGANYLVNLAPNDDEDSMVSQFEPYTGQTQTPVVTAMGRAYQLFTRHFGDINLPVTQSGISSRQIKYYVKGDSTLHSTSIASVQAVASEKTINGIENHFVMVMNTSETASKTVTVEYDNAQRFFNGAATIVRLEAKHGDLESINTPSDDDNIGIVNVATQPQWNTTNTGFSVTLPPATITVFKTMAL
jgi:hypothetical protein